MAIKCPGFPKMAENIFFFKKAPSLQQEFA